MALLSARPGSLACGLSQSALCSRAGLRRGARPGLELFSGVNVPSKAFGEFVEHACGTRSISADELKRLIARRSDLVVLDSRPFDEYQRMSIPTGINVPGAELVLRVRDVAPIAAKQWSWSTAPGAPAASSARSP